MAKKQEVSILKPTISAAALGFATGSKEQALNGLSRGTGEVGARNARKRPKTPSRQVSGLVPDGDVRLTANISEEHHTRLKIAAATQRTTIGELIEQLIDKNFG